MYWLNDCASNIGVGIFHSGIEVYGVEYAYGGHPYPFSGVFENNPQDADELGDNFKFKESILIGETDFGASDIRDMIKALGQDFRGDKYHLIYTNCNHFSATLAKIPVQQYFRGFLATFPRRHRPALPMREGTRLQHTSEYGIRSRTV